MVARLTVWLAERCAEWLLAALLLLAVFGPSDVTRTSGIFSELRIALLAVLGFYIMTGYLASTVYFGIVGRSQRPVLQAGVMVSVFLGHFAFFTLLTADSPSDPLLWRLGIFGACIVVVTTFAGSSFLMRWNASRSSFKG